ncbi:MalY/PatB family protein [uncultured Maritimibacter sp.]|jgi:cystathionine beta-lyase|uniref:MalY/PatB family protein n=1 Tax=uncultured Maritimibacter sp. TaxID=991866 RepID=UPI000B1C3276|nr:MalY/PatB family protein [uncultured Maritimibacter sp.]
MSFDFDTVHNRVGTHSAKWDKMEALYGVSPDTGISMWVADMDFPAAPPVQRALKGMMDPGIYGYYGDDAGYLAAICWWMDQRHGWTVNPEAIFTTHGLVNGYALCLDAFSKPGEGVILMTPVYHAFHRVIRSAGRELVECPLALVDGRYELDIAAWDAQMTGNERILTLCSPHNPGGRVWSRDELNALADFAKRHDLIVISDEVHHDLVFPGAAHIPMATLEGIEDRLVMMTATTKTFNIAGTHSGNVIIHDDTLRAAFSGRMMALGISPNSFGMVMAEAAYSPEGAEWVDGLVDYLDGNRRLLDQGLNAIPGVSSMALEATYLGWVDFAGTGMAAKEFTKRVEGAGIAVNHGGTFGKGGESFLRFNFATPRSLVVEAVERVQAAFSDLQ